ncbi:helix-turn-helix domain-containing protein [Marinobacterium sp. D7]|uniref:helix-turn-helix domain-containing protein n=1 Tax=Marinobacterium ramblicola TaxID=2849041 RepID=UPI001C2D2F0E|nr:helix-turn-helix domain-containing protein [Marinobacterium ramblicola]MBV1787597.1 helix-turn-helix domain-containing protein [Marinobacterium ramblicola]
MSSIPNYALYGETPEQRWFESIHYEPISRRAKHYEWKIDPHQHEGLVQMLYVQKERGVVHLDGSSVEFKAPCFILIPAQTVHGFDMGAGIDGSVVTAAQRPLESVIATAVPALADIFDKPMVLALPETARLHKTLATLFKLVEQETLLTGATELNAANMLLVSLLLQIRRIDQSQHTLNPAQGSRKAEQVERFRSMVNNNLGSLKTVDEYAEQLGITAGQLRRICQEVLGQSPLHIINARIIHAAQRDIAYSTMSIQQVAYSLGYDDAAYFSRFFRKQTGLTPSEFRERVRAHQPI